MAELVLQNRPGPSSERSDADPKKPLQQLCPRLAAAASAAVKERRKEVPWGNTVPREGKKEG